MKIQTFVVCSQCKQDYRDIEPEGKIIGYCQKKYSNYKLEGVTECPHWEAKK